MLFSPFFIVPCNHNLSLLDAAPPWSLGARRRQLLLLLIFATARPCSFTHPIFGSRLVVLEDALLPGNNLDQAVGGNLHLLVPLDLLRRRSLGAHDRVDKLLQDGGDVAVCESLPCPLI